MTTQQLSIFMENKPGQLVQVTKTLKEAGIDIRAMSLADTKDFGIVRMIVSNTEKAQEAMREAGFMSTITQVMCVAMDDQPGGLSRITELMAEAEVNIDYLYACITVIGKDAYIVMHVDDEKKASKCLEQAGIRMVGNEEIANM
ncbi:MAG: ACT domain-containing protein [Oscillospiraceae bacterium]|nr:ACT domain-containing protein [Oscillospiraceae bacterium]